jgi:thioredoxin 1
MRILGLTVIAACLTLATSGEAAAVRSVDSTSWDREVLSASKPILVDFYANWCGWCKKLAPIVEQVAIDMPEVKVVRINVDENEDLAKKYDIDGLPTLVLFSNGEALGSIEGYVAKDSLEGAIKRAMDKTRTRGSMKEKVGPFSGYPRKATK